MRELDEVLMAGLQRMRLLLRGGGNRHMQGELVRRLCEQVYRTGRLERSTQNDMRLDAVFGALLSFMPKYHAEHKEEAIALAASLIGMLFG